AEKAPTFKEIRDALDTAGDSATYVDLSIGRLFLADGVTRSEFLDRAEREVDGKNKGLALLDHGHMNRTTELKDQRDHLGDKNQLATTTSGAGTNVSNFKKICEAARSQNVTIYTIAFEAPSDAEKQMKDCAGNAANFFKINNKDKKAKTISEVFSSIAGQITQLRLSQ
ncbi:MAG: hypothetical protein WBA25_17450, partial [Jannaschia sp.]